MTDPNDESGHELIITAAATTTTTTTTTIFIHTIVYAIQETTPSHTRDGCHSASSTPGLTSYK